PAVWRRSRRHTTLFSGPCAWLCGAADGFTARDVAHRAKVVTPDGPLISLWSPRGGAPLRLGPKESLAVTKSAPSGWNRSWTRLHGKLCGKTGGSSTRRLESGGQTRRVAVQ